MAISDEQPSPRKGAAPSSPPPRRAKGSRELSFALRTLDSMAPAASRTRFGKRSAPPPPSPSPAHDGKRPRGLADRDLGPMSPPTPPVVAEAPPPNESAAGPVNPPGVVMGRSEPVGASGSDCTTVNNATAASTSACCRSDSTVLGLECSNSLGSTVASRNRTDLEQSNGVDAAINFSAMTSGIAADAAMQSSIELEGVSVLSEQHIPAKNMENSLENVTLDASPSSRMLPNNSVNVCIGNESSIAVGEVEGSLEVAVLCSLEITGASSHGCTPEKPIRRFTRSQLKAKVDDAVAPRNGASMLNGMEPRVGHVTPDNAVQFDKPQRRFTRSLIKSKVDEAKVGDCVSLSNMSGKSCEETDGSVDSGPSPKMEMKMSKKVVLTRPPGNVRELLGTGMLEGMLVMYITPNSKKPLLKGIAKGANILCFCSSCNGSKVVSAYQFEVHAGSAKKHPSDYIYLENGNSLRDVLVASSGSSLDMLEAKLRNAINPSAKKYRSTCLNCGVSLHLSPAKNFLCDFCRSTCYPRYSPGTSDPCASNDRSARKGKSPVPQKIPTVKVASRKISAKKATSTQKGSTGRLTKKDLRMHKLVFEDDILPEGTEVAYYVRSTKLRDGYIKDGGIFCRHCNKVVSPSVFEAHAGEAARRKPYDFIFTSNGVSLHELAMQLKIKKKLPVNETDDLCNICADGGDLILCDLCPRAFHAACINLPRIPEGEDWYCHNCASLKEKEKQIEYSNNAKAAGRIIGANSIEEIFKRCIRIVSAYDGDLGGCAICKEKDFSKLFDERTVILCDQCEREYHIGCLRQHQIADLKELPEGEWFCSSGCSRIHDVLQGLILQGAHQIPESDLDVLRSKCQVKGKVDNDDIQWRLFAGENGTQDVSSLLSNAVEIFHECFDPIVEANTGRDLIPAMVYRTRSDKGQDYSGMYCAMLLVGSSVVSVGLLRVLGSGVAELPLVATSREHQGMGYFQVLFGCIWKMLVSLKIKHFVLPAAEEAESIWTNKFGFSRIAEDKLEQHLDGVLLTAFQKTPTLYRPVTPS